MQCPKSEVLFLCIIEPVIDDLLKYVEVPPHIFLCVISAPSAVLYFVFLHTTMKFEKEITTVLQSRRPDTDMLNIIEVLGYSADRFQQAFDIALEMDNRSLVKLLYSNFTTGKVIVEFTLLGKNSRQ